MEAGDWEAQGPTDVSKARSKPNVETVVEPSDRIFHELRHNTYTPLDLFSS